MRFTVLLNTVTCCIYMTDFVQYLTRYERRV